MRKIFSFITGLLLFVGCNCQATKTERDDYTFRTLDETITSEYNQLKSEFVQSKFNAEDYFEKLSTISIKEDELFEQVKLHKFDDLEEYNYWHRGRLKFPSNIKMEIFRITKEKKDSL